MIKLENLKVLIIVQGDNNYGVSPIVFPLRQRKRTMPNNNWTMSVVNAVSVI